jgi:ELWxxDGT repeat protein
MNELGTGLELYVTDGTTEGTFLLKDINPGGESGLPDSFCAVGDYVYFRAYHPDSGLELWKTDGTTDGTVLVDDLNPLGDALGTFAAGAFQNKLFFHARIVNSLGTELCVSDGTENGTHLFLDINPTLDGSSDPTGFTEFDNKLYFSAYDGLNGRELWVTDGTVDGTYMFADIGTGGSSSMPTILGVCGGLMYFRAYSIEAGDELWVTDGTVPGTVMVKDIVEGNANANIFTDRCACFEDNMYFVCDDFVNGEELWKSDGSYDGTNLFKEFNTWGASYSSKPNNLTVVNNKLYFTATTTELTFQDQLFESNGSPDGTIVYNNVPVEELSNVQQLIACNDRLFFCGEFPQYFRLLSIGNSSTDIVEHIGADLSYTDEENYSTMYYFFTINNTVCFLYDFNNGIGKAWYSLNYNGGTNVAGSNINNQILTYPNPATNNFTVDPQSDSAYSLIISDISGKVIIKYDSLNGINDIDLTNFQSGIYLVQTNINGIVKTNKLLISK